MPNVRQYLLGFLYRTVVCLCLFLLCYIINRLWPEVFGAMREKLFYTINYGQLAKELKELAGCLLPK
ncbi:MAG: hypothetical protein ACI4SS_04255 [Clostridia bacterium]